LRPAIWQALANTVTKKLKKPLANQVNAICHSIRDIGKIGASWLIPLRVTPANRASGI